VKALFITPKNINLDKGIYEFSKKVSYENSCKATVRIFAACRYILYVNGNYICEGPCRSAENVRYYETVDVEFNKGENAIVVQVLHMSAEKEFASCFKAKKPMLIFQACTEYGVVNSDLDWKCEHIVNNVLINAKSLNVGMAFVPPFEHITGKRKTQELPIEECGYFDFDGVERNIFGIETPLYLEPRPIPVIYPQEPTELKVINSGDGFIELDSGKYTTAKVEFVFKAGYTYKVLYAECYQFGEEKHLRDDISGELCGAYDLVHADENMTFSPFWYRAFRFIRIECEKPEENVVEAKAYRVNYPFDISGSFECSDDAYNKMWDISINTLKCCTHEIYMDCPFYEQQQYIMDSAIESAVTMRLTEDVKMVKKCIAEFAASQQPNGLLCANYPCSYVQIIPGFSFFFVYLLKEYLDYSADIEFVSLYTSVVDKILSFFDNQVRQKGYISNSRYWDYQDWVEGWECCKAPVAEGEAITLYNLYYACALKDAAYICRKTGREGLAEDYEKRYVMIKDIINNLCFNEEKGMYRDGTNYEGYSVHTAIWSILSGVASEDKIDRVVKSLFDMSISRSSFSMNYYLFRAMEKSGVYNKAFEVIDMWRVMIDNKCTTWCEKPGNPRSECHAWSCAPINEFSSNVLGVKYSFDDEINIVPNTGHLTFAKGKVPTRFGVVSVEWKINDGIFSIDIESPANINKNLVMPDGTKYMFSEGNISFSSKV